MLEKRTDRCRFAPSEKFKNVKSVSRIWDQNDVFSYNKVNQGDYAIQLLNN